MNDIKRVSNAHVWCKSISILKAQYDCPDEWNVKQLLLLSRLNEYYGGIANSILGSHESYVPNNSPRGMYSISSGSTNIIRWKGKWAKMLSCHNKSQRCMIIFLKGNESESIDLNSKDACLYSLRGIFSKK